MTFPGVLLWAVLVLPLVASLLALLPAPSWWAPATTVIALSLTLAAAVVIAVVVTGGTAVVALRDWVECDGLSALVLLIAAYVGAIAGLFSWGYMQQEAHSSAARLRTYYFLFDLFVFSLVAVPAVVAPVIDWVAVELTAVFSILLVSFDSTSDALEAAWKYTVLTVMGGMVALLGFLLLFWVYRGAGTPFTWAGLAVSAPGLPARVLRTAFALVLVGFGTKVGFVPLHTWLPDAHSQAPSPACALLSGVKTTTALYVILRLLPIAEHSGAVRTGSWLVVIGLITLGAAAFLLAQVRDYKRLFAFSTVEHMGIILAAAGLGVPLASYGAAYQMLTHSITKSFCFLVAGAVLLLTGTREIRRVHGLAHRTPLVAGLLVLAGLGITGAPPFPVFLSELTIVRGAVAAHATVTLTLLAVLILVAFFGVTFQISRMVFGSSTIPPATPATALALPGPCVAALVIGAIPLLVLGIYTPPVLDTLFHLAGRAIQP